MNKKYYITTPIYYPSAKLHIGHSYTTVACDVLARYKRMNGYDVMFLTGTDEHGQKIEAAAQKAGKTPKEYIDPIVEGAKRLWSLMNVTYDRFVRTTDDYHTQSVQKIFKKLYDNGDIYKGNYDGMYCRDCEAFWTDNQLIDGKCPDCGRGVVPQSEEAYFFSLSKYSDKIMALYEENPEFLQPKSRVNEMIGNFLKPGLDDLCVSRTSFSWGIPVSFDPGHVVYVWIDALSSYITGLGFMNDEYDDYDKFWPAELHMMAKEIVRFHAIIWPAILMSLGEPLPKQVFGHGWLLFDGDKMSKSKGNVVDPEVLCGRYGVDAVRYYLMREIPFGQDGSFTNETLINRINSDLANDLGNLISRTVAMVSKYFDGHLPQDRQAGEFDSALIDTALSVKEKVEICLDQLQLPIALKEIFTLVSRTNKYIDETQPWVLAKDDANRPRLASVMYNLLECVRIAGVLLQPFMPNTSPQIFAQIGAKETQTTWASAGEFGLLDMDVTVVPGGVLFPRIDLEKEIAELDDIKQSADSKQPNPQNTQPPVGIINFEDFAKVNLIVAEIKACAPVPKADKLLLLTLDDGSDQPREVVSGIHEWYSPEDLIGKKIIAVSNLKPAKLRGVLSNGMILAADNGEGVSVIFADQNIPNGSKVR